MSIEEETAAVVGRTRRHREHTHGFCDIHHHLVWGLDADGPKTFDDSMAMAIAAAENGVVDIVATPHVMPGLRHFDKALYLQRLDALQIWCDERGLPLRLHPGCEIFYTPMTLQHLNEGRIPTMNGGSHVLVEFDTGLTFGEIEKACRGLSDYGYVPIIAHCERYRAFLGRPKAVVRLKEECGLALQINCGALLYGKDFWTKRFLKRLLRIQAIDCVCSDAHDTARRPVQMKQAHALLEEWLSATYLNALFAERALELLRQ